MKVVIIVISFICPALLFAQTYNVNLIPDVLKSNVNAVKRFEELKVIIKSPAKAIVKHKWAITIFNEEGERYSGYANTYSKMFSIQGVDGHLYDASGKEIKSVKKKDLSDESYDDQMSLATDDRLKRHNFYYKSFPYTVEYEDEVEYEGIFFLPRWTPVSSEKFSVQQSRFIVEAPADYRLRYKELNTSSAKITPGTKTTTYQWELSNVPGFKYEPFQPEIAEVTPSVFVAASDFEFGGYKGNMNSWQNLGKYMNTLYAGRDKLPEQIKKDIHRITDNVASQKEKIKLLYEYLQKNTRYISIQLGIGGWQPFDATYVATKGYGDCKALSNYMVSILKEAGIKANPVIIKAGQGERGLWEDFPAPLFNHVVMCIPDGKDTTWLECTSQTNSAGYMGSSTGNRKALMLTEEGGFVVNTPSYGISQNIQVRKINAAINTEGSLSADVNTFFTGEQQELQHSLIHSVNKEQREKYLNEALNLPTYTIEKSAYKEVKSSVPSVEEYLKVQAPNYASITGKRIFIQPNLFNKLSTKLSTEQARKFNIKFDYAYRDIDTIHISLPEGYQSESVPKDVALQSKFGNYSIKFNVNATGIDVVRISERNAGVFDSSNYPDLVKFYDEIYKADRSKIVLVKKESQP